MSAADSDFPIGRVVSMTVKRSDGGVTAPMGFSAAGVSAGIKSGGELDLGLLYSQVRCAAAGVYTTNQLKGESLQVSMEHLRDGYAQAVVVNSGNANACTGERGLLDAREMARTVLYSRSASLMRSSYCRGVTSRENGRSRP